MPILIPGVSFHKERKFEKVEKLGGFILPVEMLGWPCIPGRDTAWAGLVFQVDILHGLAFHSR
jgi:hypothetical protein